MDNHAAKDIGMKRSASELALQEYLTTSPLDPCFDLINRVSLWFLLSVVSLVRIFVACVYIKIQRLYSMRVLFFFFLLQDTCELRDILLWSEGLIPAGTFRDAQSSICGMCMSL